MTVYHDRPAEGRLSTSKDYQREAEHTRRRLAENLDELGDRLTPGQVFDEMLTYSRVGGGTFFRAFSNAMRENPLPSLMIGAGCVMFLSEKMGLRAGRGNGGRPMKSAPDEPYGVSSSVSEVGERLSQSAGRVSDAAGRVSDAAARMTGSAASGAHAAAASVRSAAEATQRQASDLTGGAIEAARQTAATVGETAANAVDVLRGAAHDARDQASAAMTGAAASMQDTAASMGGRIADAADRTRRQAAGTVRQGRESATSFISEQPLLCAAIGVAIGATLASMIPSTDAEDKLMGETSDAVKGAAQRTGSQALESAKNVAGKVADRAQTAAREEGLSASGVAEAVRNTGDGSDKSAQSALAQPVTGTAPQEGTLGSNQI